MRPCVPTVIAVAVIGLGLYWLGKTWWLTRTPKLMLHDIVPNMPRRTKFMGPFSEN